jgi:amino acid transporter
MMVLSALLFIAGGTRWFFRFQIACFILYVISMVIVVVLGRTTSSGDFLRHFNDYAAHLGQAHASTALAASAAKGGYVASSGLSLHASLMAVSVFWFIFGFTYSSNYFAGEIRATKRAHLYSIPGAALLGIVVLLILAPTYTHFASYAFNAKLGFANPAAYGFSGGAPAYPEISAIATGSAFWGTLILLGFTLGLIVWLPQTMLLISRSMFAWSFDRLMPAKLSYINPRTRTPVVALLVITLLGVGSTAIYAFTTWFSTLSVLLGLSLTLLFTAVSGIVLPFRRRQLFESSAFNQRIAGIPVLSIVATLALAGFGIAIGILLTDPGSGTSLAHNPGKLELAVGVYALAGVIYLVAAAVRRRQGIDLRLAYREIPPE